MAKTSYDIGMVGLGTMGRNLVLNIASNGFSVIGYDKDAETVALMEKAAEATTKEGWGKIGVAKSIGAFVQALDPPRAVMMMVPPGAPVDAVIKDLLPYLEPGDIVIDGGNSFFEHTDQRLKQLAEKSIAFLGVGISGGERGARYGPSIMPGGTKEAYSRIRPIFEAIAAKYKDEPCVAYLGPGSAGHYVKMVHNGIEYGLMELIAETYDLMKRGLGYDAEQLETVYRRWDTGELESYLIEITSHIFKMREPESEQYLIDLILGEAHQLGTGRWASQDALDLGVPTPTIDIAVVMRNLSGMGAERLAVSKELKGPDKSYDGDPDAFVEHLQGAFYAAMILTYAQGMDQLQAASEAYVFDLDLETVARIWRAGCIIRSAFLEKIRNAFHQQADLPNLILDPKVANLLKQHEGDLREIVKVGAILGIPTAGLASALAYYDGYRSAWLPANLIQAQRDYFGAHTYERVDVKGVFHTEWEEY